MINKPFEEITIEDIKNLKESSVAEGKTIEYKEKVDIKTVGGKKEFLGDVSSFANTIGGDLIIGIKEKKRIKTPDKIIGVSIKDEDIEVEKSRLENIIQMGIQPKIQFSIRSIKLENQNKIIIIRIYKSWIGPHRVIYRGHDKFYARNSTGKYQMDIWELRTAFNLSETLIEKIRNFRIQRIAELAANNTPIPFFEGAKTILHLIPLTSFSPNIIYNIDYIANNPSELPPIYASGWRKRNTFEGFITYDQKTIESKISYSYAHFYRNGIIEAVEGILLNRGRLMDKNQKAGIPSAAFEESLFKPILKYLKLQKKLGVDTPIYLFLTLTGIKNNVLILGNRRYSEEINRDILDLPESVIENLDINLIDIINILKPLYDIIWNAFGLPRSFNFDENGRWIASRLKI